VLTIRQRITHHVTTYQKLISSTAFFYKFRIGHGVTSCPRIHNLGSGKQIPRVFSTLACLPSHNTWISWHSRSSLASQMSSSESSLLEEQMQEKHQSCREWLTPLRVQRYTGLINRETGHWYVLFSIALSISSSCQLEKLDPSMEVGRVYSRR
jgi:hypothetical protein